MAEICVSYFLKNLDNLNHHEADVINDVRNQLDLVAEKMRHIQKLLRDADAKQEGDYRIRIWLGDVTDITHDLEDVIDTFISKVAPLKISLQNTKKSVCPAIIEKWIARYIVYRAHSNFDTQIKRILDGIRVIFEKASTYCIESSDEVESPNEIVQGREWFSTSFEEHAIVSSEEEVRTLISRLSELDKQRSVISIVGTGGSGKTTLAQEIYTNDFVESQFNCRAWVHVSQKYTGRELLTNMARQLLGVEAEIFEFASKKDLVAELYEFLMEKRYLIVLDDVWENEVWDEVKVALPCGMNGSIILITTRNKDVALPFDPSSRPHELRLLSCKESWELLCKKLFNTENSTTSLELADLEKLKAQFVARCDGLPLLEEIQDLTMGKSKIDKLRVLRSVNLHKELYLKILGLIYHQLPTHLKWCFLYCGIFPDDYVIPARKLLMLWVAEGFTDPILGRTEEDTAEEYLEQLNHRTLIQAVTRKLDGRIQTCRVHRLLREIALSEAKKTDFLGNGTGKDYEWRPHVRRQGIHSSIDDYISLMVGLNMHYQRTVLYFGSSRDCILENRRLEYIAKMLKLIRVLDLEGLCLSEVPDVIGTLIHLKYLGLKRTCLKSVPSAIGRLYNLKVLDVSCNYIKELPLSICNLRNLYTLDIRRNLITSIPSEISGIKELRHLYMDKEVVSRELHIDQLTNIQTLSVVHAGSWIREAFRRLRNLDKLRIYGGFYVDFKEEIWEFISDLDHLRSLELVVSKRIPVLAQLPFPHLLGLHKLHLSGQLTRPLNVQDFPPNLVQLSLSWSYLEEDPIAVLEKLPNLRILLLQMQAYVGKQMVFSRNGFPRLEFLKLKSLNKLQDCEVEQGAMPVLTQLCISRCVQLKRLPQGLEFLTTLQKLELLWMLPTSLAVAQEHWRANRYKIRNIPSVVLSGTPFAGSKG